MSNKLSKKKTDATNKTKDISIKWEVSDEIIPRFANNMIIQTVENALKISFFELSASITFSENQSEAITTRRVTHDTVKANCVSSVIIPETKIPSFIEALQKHYDSHVQKNKNKSEES